MQYLPFQTIKHIDLEEIPQYCILNKWGHKHFIYRAPQAKGKVTNFITENTRSWWADNDDKPNFEKMGKTAVYKLNGNKYDLIFEFNSPLGIAWSDEIITKDEMYKQINW